MLRLERMEMCGFKSFSERTKVVFPPGITAVVGPNGCGKSNLGDAINWVLGEQSPKLLRGKNMADVIFNGSEKRKPLGMAEVSLVFSGGDALAAADDGKTVITRKLYRSGESDYLINGKRSRLKDIQELMNQERVGARSYATIEQGRIDQILNAKPKDRRALIEDAAGIGGFKHKRRLTELKLEATHANLLRVNDIVLEVERQIRTLKRQASRARRYRRLREELRECERVQFGARANELDRQLVVARTAEAEGRDVEAAAAAAMAQADAGLAEKRQELERASETFRQNSERLHQLEIAVDREETRIRSAGEQSAELRAGAERADAEAEILDGRRAEIERTRIEQQRRVEVGRAELQEIQAIVRQSQEALNRAESDYRELHASIESLRRDHFAAMNRAVDQRNRIRSEREALERNAARTESVQGEAVSAREELDRTRAEMISLRDQLANHETRLDEMRKAFEQVENELHGQRVHHADRVALLADAREEHRSAVARLATLEDVETRFAGVSDGVRMLLGADASTGFRTSGVVADLVEAGPEVEQAAESYLGAFLPTVIVESDADVTRATAMLREAGAGRTSLICRTQPAGGFAVGAAENGHGPVPARMFADPRVRGRLRDRLSLRTTANGALENRLGDAVLVDRLETALELHRTHPSTDYLTDDGDIVYASGVVTTGGKSSGDQGMLAHKRKIREAREVALAAEESVARLGRDVDDETGRLANLEARLREIRAELETAGQRRIELEMGSRRSSEEVDRGDRRCKVLGDELSALAGETERLTDSIRGLEGSLREAEEARADVERKLEELTSNVDEARERMKSAGDELGTRRAELAARQERQEGIELEGRRLEERSQELGQRASSLRETAGSNRARVAELESLGVSTGESLARNLESRGLLAQETAKMETEIAESQRNVSADEAALRHLREELERKREVTREAELERTRIEASRQHLDDLCRQELGMTASEACEAAGEALETADLEKLDVQVAELKGQIERIGPVNMTAIEEFTELEERHTFLTSQRKDLDESMQSLRETIKRINRSSREKFLHAFEAIRTHYQEIFKLLFNGGRADLRLEEGEDVLDCGIEIMVQPPGKRLGNISLMSGGEKAMSAIALLFAIFRYRPSPFCLLDEVDAALDDANVGRFATMVKQYAEQTQFVLITHNKLSMESADLLYGVTMNEPGVSRLMSIEFQ